MEIPESWKRMKEDFVAQTEAWGRGISEEMSFLGGRLKEFWADPEKLISTPREEGALLPELGLIPQTAVENVKGEKSRALWERIKTGDPEAAAEYAMEYMGETGGILRKEAVKHLATRAKGIMELADIADPVTAPEVKGTVLKTLKEVIPAVRKLKQEIWDPISDTDWKMYYKESTLGDIDIDNTMLMRMNPYKATAHTVYHEAGGHGMLVKPTEAIKKAQVEYKGELVPATEVSDYIYRVNRAWRGRKDYMDKLYDKDPAEMLARTVAMDTAKGTDIEQAFLDRLPKVVKRFEDINPEMAERYRTPLLERAAQKAEEKVVDPYATELATMAKRYKTREEFETDLLRRSVETDEYIKPEHYEYLVRKYPKLADEIGAEDLGMDWIANPAFLDSTSLDDIKYLTGEKTQKKVAGWFDEIWGRRPRIMGS